MPKYSLDSILLTDVHGLGNQNIGQLKDFPLIYYTVTKYWDEIKDF